MTQRVGGAQILLHECLVYDSYRTRFPRISIGHIASRQNRNAHGVEEIRADSVCAKKSSLLLHSVHRQVVVVGPSGSWPVAHHRNRFHTRQLLQAIEQLTVKNMPVYVGLRRDPEDE